MSVSGIALRPSSCLPPIRALRTATTTEDEVTKALKGLHALYCPLRLPQSVHKPRQPSFSVSAVDSGYVSQDEDEDDDSDSADTEESILNLRIDEFELSVATRWLTTLIACAETIEFDTEDARERALDDAAFILSSFSDSTEDQTEEALTRDFDFPTADGGSVKVQLNDAPLSGTDHTDVGLQSWGASIVMSSMMCAEPGRFGLGDLPSSTDIIELGAGTGLVGLTIATLLPHLATEGANVYATDYHPTVLENLRANIATNFSLTSTPPVKAALLDWSDPVTPSNLPAQVPLLFAADVVYAKEHAIWLRDCASRLLAPGGAFWLMVTVRDHGKFEGIAATVEDAFEKENTTGLNILEKQRVEKRRGIGRGDEVCYFLYRIGWV